MQWSGDGLGPGPGPGLARGRPPFHSLDLQFKSSKPVERDCVPPSIVYLLRLTTFGSTIDRISDKIHTYTMRSQFITKKYKICEAFRIIVEF